MAQTRSVLVRALMASTTNAVDDNSGAPFSRVYLSPAEPVQDSERFRRRVAGFVTEKFWLHRYNISQALVRELGVQISHYQDSQNQFHPNLRDFFVSAQLRDVLDSVTVIFHELAALQMRHKVAVDWTGWLPFVERALREEGMQYRINAKGAIRFLVDQEFERVRSSSLTWVATMPAVASELEKGFEHLASVKPDPKAAIRSVFEATETFCKIAFETNEGLSDRTAVPLTFWKHEVSC